jgi:hypothetical protein
MTSGAPLGAASRPGAGAKAPSMRKPGTATGAWLPLARNSAQERIPNQTRPYEIRNSPLKLETERLAVNNRKIARSKAAGQTMTPSPGGMVPTRIQMRAVLANARTPAATVRDVARLRRGLPDQRIFRNQNEPWPRVRIRSTARRGRRRARGRTERPAFPCHRESRGFLIDLGHGCQGHVADVPGWVERRRSGNPKAPD